MSNKHKLLFYKLLSCCKLRLGFIVCSTQKNHRVKVRFHRSSYQTQDVLLPCLRRSHPILKVKIALIKLYCLLFSYCCANMYKYIVLQYIKHHQKGFPVARIKNHRPTWQPRVFEKFKFLQNLRKS